jgi:NADH-quinone oxidoreductase subunit G
MPKCTINGQEVEVKDGATIMEAFYKLDDGKGIAHYCYHPGLSVAGVCRLCIVDIEGNPRPQIACNTAVTEGMKISNKSEKIKDGVKWVLDFHLINHPLDCPICDQAGECGLQDQYMQFGKYSSEMAEPKVKKHKVVDLGPTVVLDTERCILCARCVRFTDEVSKTNELGLFNRGDRTEIGTFDGKPLDNNYSLNTVDICPVGALTSKDFRFRQRVWYLKDSESLCTGCSTGCNVKVYYNKEGAFRVKPVYNEKVNGHWMCDEGRGIYKFVNREHRLLKGRMKLKGQSTWTDMDAGALALDASKAIKSAGDKLAVVLTGQYSTHEYETMMKNLPTKKVYHWKNSPEKWNEFDGLLLRGDRNPNTKGLEKELSAAGIKADWSDLLNGIKSGTIETIIVAGPENLAVYEDMSEKIQLLGGVQNLIWTTACKSEFFEKLDNNVWLVPMKSYLEKDGSFINQQGLEQKFKKATTIVSEALTLSEASYLLSGKNIPVMKVAAVDTFIDVAQRADQVTLEHRKKNEFVYKRGSL